MPDLSPGLSTCLRSCTIGTAATVRGVLRNYDTSAGEAGAPFADAGPVLWIAFGGDIEQIEFVQYKEPATDRDHP